MHQAGFLQHAKHVLHVDLAIAFLGRERQLERRALHVIDEDVQVVRIDERVFGRGVEEERRMPRNELIDRRARRHHHRRRLPRATAGTAGALPRRGDRAGITRHDAHIERADVDAELERVGRHDATNLAGAQALLDLAAPQRQVSAAIATNALGHAGHILEIFLEIGGEDLRRQPALREDDHLQVAAQELARHATRLRDVRAPDAELAIHDRRIDEHEKLLALRRAALLDVRERLLGQALGQLARDSRWSPTSR